MFVCCQGDSGSTKPALNSDSTRALIHPTNRSVASLLSEYMKTCLSAPPSVSTLHWPSLSCVSPSYRYYVKQCAAFYNVSAEQLAQAVALTNEYYGGYGIRANRIVFPNGSIDPWHALGITQDIAPDLPAVFIKGEKECVCWDIRR